MRTQLHRALLGASFLAMVLAANARPTSLELRVDGMLRMKGSTLHGARAVIVSDDAATMVLREGLAHFAHPFQLQTRYLISFEREGCVTKQILFDTHVPTGYLGFAPFYFPFEVTLAPPPSGIMFEYAGPVGFVRFMVELEDFGYDTDYRIKSDPPLQERLREFRISETGSSIVADRSAGSTPGPNLEEPASSPDLRDDDVLAPMLSRVPPLVHLVLRPGEIKSIPVPVRDKVTPNLVTVPAPIEAAPVAKPRPRPLAMEPRVPALVQPAGIEEAADMREEELLVEPRSVTTIVRIRRSGQLSEFRRVAHQYGAVFFFKNGQSCTELQYTVGVA